MIDAALGGRRAFAYLHSVMSEFSRPTVRLPSGERVPQLGQGHMEHGRKRTYAKGRSRRFGLASISGLDRHR